MQNDSTYSNNNKKKKKSAETQSTHTVNLPPCHYTKNEKKVCHEGAEQ